MDMAGEMMDMVGEMMDMVGFTQNLPAQNGNFYYDWR